MSKLPLGVLLGTVFFSSLTSSCTSPSAKQVGTSQQEIVNGQPADPSQIDGTVAIVVEVSGGAWSCTGTLIGPRLVTTAAHCLLDDSNHKVKASAVTVMAGTMNSYNATNAQTYSASLAVPHPQYNPNASSSDQAGLTRENDLGLIETSTEVTQLKPVTVLPMALVDSKLSKGTNIWIEGYGTRTIDQQGQPQDDGDLYVGQLTWVRRSDGEFLAGNSSESDTCEGDSGGPVYLDADGKTYVIGATSRAREDGNAICGEGGIYTLLPAYLDWIDATKTTPRAGEDDPVNPPDAGTDAGTQHPDVDAGSDVDAGQTQPGTGDGDSHGDGDNAGDGDHTGGGDGDHAGDGDALGDGDAHGDAGTTTTTDPSTGTHGVVRRQDRGCSVVQPGAGSDASAWLLLLVPGAVLLNARRRRHTQETR